MSKYQITQFIRESILTLQNKGLSKTEINKELQKTLGWDRRKVGAAINQVLSDSAELASRETTKHIKAEEIGARILAKAKAHKLVPAEISLSNASVEKIVDAGTHTYNSETDQFIWQMKDGSKVVLATVVWKAILREYKGGSSIQQIALKHHVLVSKLTEILKKESITHDTPPVTSQDLKTKDVDTITSEEAKFKIAQDMEKSAWRLTQVDADKWRAFEYGTLDPIQEFFSTWQPKAYAPVTSPVVKSTNDDVFVIGLSDLHFGAFTSETTTFSGKSYSTKQAVEAVSVYAYKIQQKLAEYKNAPSKAVILLMGDILHTHTNDGRTTKGTPLKYDVTGPEQLQTAFNSLHQFINCMLQLFMTVEIHSVRGNHSGNGDYALALALKQYYRSEPKVSFNNHTADHALVEIGKSTLAILTHGASDEVKAILPSSDAARQNWALNLFAQYNGNLSKKKQKLLFSADQHHIEVKEYASFTHYMFPTAVTGDHYAESKGLHNRAAQLCLIVSDDGGTTHLPIYL